MEKQAEKIDQLARKVTDADVALGKVILELSEEVVPPNMLPDLSRRLGESIKALESADQSVKEHVEAMEYKISKKQAVHKKHRLADYYKRHGLQLAMEAGGFGKSVAKLCSTRFFSEEEISLVVVNPDTLIEDKICVWAEKGIALLEGWAEQLGEDCPCL